VKLLIIVCLITAPTFGQTTSGSTPVSSPLQGQNELPDVDYGNGVYVTVWHRNSQIFASAINAATGSVVGAPVPLGQTNAPGEDSHPVVIHTGNPSGSGPAACFASSPFSPSQMPGSSLIGGSVFIVVWEARNGTSVNDWDLRGVRLTASPITGIGTVTTPFWLVQAPEHQRFPDLGATGYGLSNTPRVLLVWEDELVASPAQKDVYGRVLDHLGTPVPVGLLGVNPFIIAGGGGAQFRPAVSKHPEFPSNQESLGVVYVDSPSANPSNPGPAGVIKNVRVQNIHSSGGLASVTVISSSPGLEPDIAGMGSSQVFVWQDAGGAILGNYRIGSGTTSGTPVVIDANGVRPSVQMAPSSRYWNTGDPTIGRFLIAYAQSGGGTWSVQARGVNWDLSPFTGTLTFAGFGAGNGSPQVAWDVDWTCYHPNQPTHAAADRALLVYDKNGTGAASSSSIEGRRWTCGSVYNPVAPTTTLMPAGPVSIGTSGWQVQFASPSDAGRQFAWAISSGGTGLQTPDWRAIPLAPGPLLQSTITLGPSWSLNGSGLGSTGPLSVPANPALIGMTFHVGFAVLSGNGCGGFGTIGPSIAITIT